MRDFYEGSPAHAGIDLARTIDISPFIGFPRTRGDRPMLQKLIDALTSGSPAHAGIDLQARIQSL